MKERLKNAGSGAAFCGVVVAFLGIVFDRVYIPHPLLTGPAIFYFLIGWLLGLSFGLLTGAPMPPIGGALLAAGAFALYPVNVFWLAGLRWKAPESLATDFLVLLAFMLAVFWLRKWSMRPAAPGPRSAWLGLAAAVGCAAFLFSGSLAPALDRAGKGPDILLLVLDSVRRDHVSFLGHKPKTASPFEQYLSDARVYEQAYATSSWTYPSTRDILGVAPGQASASGFPSRLTALGYATLMLTDNPHLAGPPLEYFGFEEKRRSVADWRYRISKSIAAEVLDRVRQGNDRGLADLLAMWVSRRTGPVYVHAHLMNAHAPFRFPPIDRVERPGRTIEFPFTGQEMTEAERQSIIARYDGGVYTAFAAARRMIETMRGRKRPLLVLLTADHGELLGEGGQWFHGSGLDEELLRVPLVAWGEGVSPGRVRGLATNAQLAETIMAAATGTVAPRDLRTSSGLEVVDGALPGSAAFRIMGPYKVVVSRKEPPQLLRLTAADSTGYISPKERRLATLLAAGLGIPDAAYQPLPIDDVTREALRSLGYLK